MRLSMYISSLLPALVVSFVIRSPTRVAPRPTAAATALASSAQQAPANAYNSVPVAKEGGPGVASASQQAAQRKLSLGAPPTRPKGGEYTTKGGIQVTAQVDRLRFSDAMESGTSAFAIEELVRRLDSRKGVLLQSSYEFPGRYARWSLGFVDPPLEISGRGSKCSIRALNDRGKVLMGSIEKSMRQLEAQGVLEAVQVHGNEAEARQVDVTVVPPPEVGTFSEEERSRQPSLFSVVRALIDLFSFQGGDRQLGLYGAFGYDLTFQFESIDLKQERDPEQRDIVLYLPDEIVVVDQDKRDAWKVSYEFAVGGHSTFGVPSEGSVVPFQPFDTATTNFVERDTPKHEFADSVDKAKKEFAVGNLFEAVLSQTFRQKLDENVAPSVMFRRLRARNPAPYGFFINLGEQEYLVGASPEMFVRCEAVEENDYRPGAIRVETCPISGTVARGADALEDAARVKSLMMNAKEESELTMCTDVDRNDKSRICEPGSVQVIGRRQIEMYSRLIHTVDHVEGFLRPEFDALDAFLCHTWAVTVTGAPKTWAIQFVEDTERSPRCWYGGAVGMVGFDGGMNTGLTLRTIRIKNGVAEVRAGATLLFDSNPSAEELETELKASAMMDAIMREGPEDKGQSQPKLTKTDIKVGDGKSIILIDHEDSFVHTLGNYLRQTGATVRTLRSGASAIKVLDDLVQKGMKPDLVVLSPGPGNPSDFGLSTTIDCVVRHGIPAFGVCLGLQGMAEHFGGTLGVLSYPMHGKPSLVSLTRAGKEEGSIFTSLPDTFEVARYHSLHAIKNCLPDSLEVTAQTEDGIVMGLQHKDLPLAAVQFHPESILTSPAHGMTILINVLKYLKGREGPVKKSGAQIVAELESLPSEELADKLRQCDLSTKGTKSELVVRLALRQHKASEFQAGRLTLSEMSESALRELMVGMGLKKDASSKGSLIEIIEKCLRVQL